MNLRVRPCLLWGKRQIKRPKYQVLNCTAGIFVQYAKTDIWITMACLTCPVPGAGSAWEAAFPDKDGFLAPEGQQVVPSLWPIASRA
jgi:hypothetical protein